jgi:hypothetical protein
MAKAKAKRAGHFEPEFWIARWLSGAIGGRSFPSFLGKNRRSAALENAF